MQYDHDFLANVISKVSLRFRNLATDYTLWTGCVWIFPGNDFKKAKFVIQQCIHKETTELWMDNGRGTRYHLPPNDWLWDGYPWGYEEWKKRRLAKERQWKEEERTGCLQNGESDPTANFKRLMLVNWEEYVALWRGK